MQLIDFTDACDIGSKTDVERFELICYYKAKEEGMRSFSVRKILEVYAEAGLTLPDRPVLEKEVKRSKSFRPFGIEGTLRFTIIVFEKLDRKYGHLWTSMNSVPTDSEVVNEKRFCGRRDGFDRLISQINLSYRNESYDACASVMRRFLEAALILSFQSVGTENEIRGVDGRYIDLGGIIRKVIEDNALGMSQKGKDLLSISEIGDYSRQGPMYTFSANDINSVRIAYRELLDILYNISFPDGQR